MSNPYTSVSQNGFNANPPPDDGTQVAANEAQWGVQVIGKVGTPLKDLAEGINTNVSAAFDKILGAAINVQSANYTVVASDQGKLISCINTITVTLIATATAGTNFTFAIRNNGTGTVTLDGNAAETINGAATIVLLPGQAAILASTGTAWFALLTLPDPPSGIFGQTLSVNSGATGFEYSGKNLAKDHGTKAGNFTLQLDEAELHLVAFSAVATLTIASTETNDKATVVVKNGANAITLAGIDVAAPTLTNAASTQDLLAIAKSFGKIIVTAAMLNVVTV